MGDSKFQKSERALVTLLKKKKKEEKLGQLRYFIVTILVDYHNQPFIIFIDTRARSLSSFVECRTENTEWKRKFFVASTKKSSGDPRWPSIPRLILLEYAVDRARDAASILDATLSLSLSLSSRKQGCVLSLRRVVLLSGTIGASRGILTARCPGNLRVRICEAGNWDTLQRLVSLQITRRTRRQETKL